MLFIEPDLDRHSNWHAAHMTFSEMFKPEISIVLENPFGTPYDDNSELAGFIRESRRTGQDIIVHLRVIADGRTALIERV